MDSEVGRMEEDMVVAWCMDMVVVVLVRELLVLELLVLVLRLVLVVLLETVLVLGTALVLLRMLLEYGP
jgi:hypothetical protein